MILYFLRHGLAGDSEEWEGDDDLRPLTKKGREQMEATSETLALLDIKPTMIITSPLIRARQTADIAAQNLYLTDRVLEDERLAPGFDPEELAAILEDHPDAAELMLVGHEPDFSSTVSALIGGGNIVMKKGGLARVDLPDPHVLQGDLIWLLSPKVLTL